MTAELQSAGDGRVRRGGISGHTRFGLTRALLGVLALVVLVSGGLLVTRALWPESAPLGPPDQFAEDEERWRRDEARQAAIEAVFAQRAKAVLTRDRATFMATIDPQSGAFRARQARWFDNIAAVPFAEWRYDPGPPDPSLLRPERRQLLGPEAVVIQAEVTYRLQGFDRVGRDHDENFTLVPRDGRWLIADDTDGADAPGSKATQIWDIGKVNVVARPRVLVLGLGDTALLGRYATEVESVMARVSAVVGDDWPKRVVVMVPGTTAQMAQLLGNSTGTYAKIAAVVRGELGTTLDQSPVDRLFVNPAKFGQVLSAGRQREGEMPPRGRRNLLTHELVHVATRSYTQDWTPKWLSEGLADYVAFKGRSARAGAPELARDVRAGKVPSQLPDNAEFGYEDDGLAQSYGMGWLACRYIAETYGEKALVRFYRAVGTAPAGTDGQVLVAQLLRSQLGTSEAEFTKNWRAYLKRVMG